MKIPDFLIPPGPGDFLCGLWHIWWAWIKVIGTTTGKTWFVCRACGREWALW